MDIFWIFDLWPSMLLTVISNEKHSYKPNLSTVHLGKVPLFTSFKILISYLRKIIFFTLTDFFFHKIWGTFLFSLQLKYSQINWRSFLFVWLETLTSHMMDVILDVFTKRLSHGSLFSSTKTYTRRAVFFFKFKRD